MTHVAWNPTRTNHDFYDSLWSHARLTMPEAFNTWPLVASLFRRGTVGLEIGPGLHPRLPLDASCFVDTSRRAVDALRTAGAHAIHATVTPLALPNERFDVLCACDVLEHTDDEAMLAELTRVARDDARLVISAPLHPHRWTEFDAIVGHVRRYEPRGLERLLSRHGWAIERSAPFGMKPHDGVLCRLATWQLRTHRDRALEWYERFLFPFALRRQMPLALRAGFDGAEPCDDVLLVCRRK